MAIDTNEKQAKNSAGKSSFSKVWLSRLLVFGAGGLAAAALLPATFAEAQLSIEQRIGRLEQDMSAVQRKVFPASNGGYIQPEYGPNTGNNDGVANTNASITPELLGRLDSLEGAVMQLTGRVEEQDLRLEAMERKMGVAATPAAPVSVPVAPQPTPTSAPTSAPKVDPNRVAAVAAITKPSTGDAGEDAYSYGFRLWEGGFYPEAQIALQDYVTKYPSHSRISYGRNLLGRAFLDDGKPATSVDIFLKNYQDNPKGARAPDSLLYLSQAMIRIDKKDKACIVLEELNDVYPDTVAGRLASDVKARKKEAGCK